MQTVYQQAFNIRAYEIDPHGFASIQTVCNFLQEAAANHANKLGVSIHILFAQKLAWILSRLHVIIDRYPEWGEQVTVETWPALAQDKFALRDFLIFDQNEKIIARAVASYMVLDLNLLKPVSIPDFILQIPRPQRERAFEASFPKLPQVNHTDIEKTFNVRFSDLDVNRYVNNVCYIEWAAETIPLETWQSHQIRELEISFRSETKYGDRISVTAQKNEDQFLHEIRSENDRRDVARMRSFWIRKP